MDNRIYEIFRECFPQFPMDIGTFAHLLDADNCRIITHTENGNVVGFSAVKGNCIRLICVEPEFCGRGIGSGLLRKSEELISSEGSETAILGGTDSELFIGAVTSEEQWKDMRCPFFENRGYDAFNGCIEMKMSLSGFSDDMIPECPADVSFGYCPENKRGELYEAVRKVDEDWIQFFDMGSPVFTAVQDGKIVGSCIVDVNADTIISDGKKNIGMIGCVGVVPGSRRKGIGLAMVAKAMSDIKAKGCDEVFIHYTHLDWWYRRLGFETFLYYWFGQKKLK